MRSDPVNPRLRRRELLHGSWSVVWLASAAGARGGKISKEDFMYQDKPKGAASCATCKLFVTTPGGTGECTLFGSEVSRDGWCMAYSARERP